MPAETAPGTSTAPLRPPRRPRWGRIAVFALLAYLLMTLMLYWLQTSIIFPGSALQGSPLARVNPPPGAELVELRTRGGEKVAALHMSAATADGAVDPLAGRRPTLLFFYGNGMSLAGAVDQMEDLRRLGINVLCPDYVGYGMSTGKPSESGCYETADAAYDYLVSVRNAEPGRVVALGWSLGGGVAVDLASRRKVGGLVALSTFSSLVDVARLRFPFLPASLLLRHRFESAAKMARVRCPVFVGHGREDDVVPFELSDRLAQAAAGPVTRYSLPGAGHVDFWDAGGRDLLLALRRFVFASTGTPPPREPSGPHLPPRRSRPE